MNKIFSLSWSESRQAWVVVSELCSGCQRPKSLARAVSALILTLAGAASLVNANAATQSDVVITLTSTVSAGETIISGVIQGGELSVTSGGEVKDITIEDNNGGRGRMIISSGGSAGNVNVKADFTSGHSAGGLYVLSGGVAQNVTVSGTTTDGTGNEYKYVGLTVDSGGKVENVTTNNYGYTVLSDGAKVTSAVLAGGRIIVSAGSELVSARVDGGSLWAEGKVDNVYVASGGGIVTTGGAADVTYAYIAPGGGFHADTNATIRGSNASGAFFIDGATHTASNVIVDGGIGHQLFVHSGQALNTTVINGSARIYSGAEAHGTILNGPNSALSLSAALQAVSAGGHAYNTVIFQGKEWVTSGGVATSTTIHSGGVQSAARYATTYSTVILDGGIQMIGNGTAADTTINNGGVQDIKAGNITDTIINSGGTQNNSTGSATGTIINSGGVQNNTYQAKTFSTTINTGGTQNLQLRSLASATTLNGGTQNVSADQLSPSMASASASTTVINFQGRQNIYKGGRAEDTTINSGGTQNVKSGGIATGTTVSTGGIQNVYSAASVSATTLNGGAQNIYADASATSTIITSGGVQSIDSASVTDTIVNTGGIQDVHSAASASATTLNGGTQNIFSGGSVADTTVNTGGIQYVHSAASASATTLNGGTQNIFSGGSVADTTVNPGGIQNVYSAASASATTLDGGTQNIYDGGSGADTTVNTGGIQNIYADASVTSTIINSGGTLNLRSGGSSDSIIQNSGGALITSTDADASGTHDHGAFSVDSSFASATNVLLENGGKLTVLSGATATDSLVSRGGELLIHSGARLSGLTTVTDGGILTGSAVINDGSLLFLQHGSGIYSGNLTGSGSVTQDGGALTLEGQLVQEGGIFLNSGGVMTMNNLTAVTNITAQSGTQLLLAGNTVLSGTIDPTDVTVGDRAVWNITGDSLTDTLHLAGTINFSHNPGLFSAHTLTVSGLRGSGGTLVLHSVLKDSSSETDRLVIDGGTASGSTFLQIVNDGGMGAPTTGKGIPVVMAINGATTDLSAFHMSAPVDVGAYRYNLSRNADESWYLSTSYIPVVTVPPVNPPAATVPPVNPPAVTVPPVNPPVVTVPSVNPPATATTYSNAAWIYPSLAVRAMDYDRQLVGDKDTRRNLVSTDEQSGRRFWGRMRTGKLTYKNNAYTPTRALSNGDTEYAFVQMGADILSHHTPREEWSTGIYGAVGSNNGTSLRGDDGQKAGKMDGTIYSFGLYLTGTYNNGFYTDNIIQFSRHLVSAATQQKAGLSSYGTGITVSLESGKAWNFSPGLIVEPQIQYVWQHLGFENASDSNGTVFHSDNNHRHQVRAGIKFGNQIADNTNPVSFWLRPSVIHTLEGRGKTTLSAKGVANSELDFNLDQQGTAASLEGGVDLNVGTNGTLGLRVGGSEKLKASIPEGYYGQMNLKLTF